MASPSSKHPVPFRLALLLLFAIIGVLHFWRLGSHPSGFFCDECSIGYNAWCILQTGADEYGSRWPVFFRAFDNYHDTVMVYSLAPLEALFGLKEWVVRLPSAIFHILAAIAFAFLAQEYCRNRWLALAAGSVFSVIPWVFPCSRTILSGYTGMLFGMAAGWALLVRAFRQRSHGAAVAAGLAWALAMYAHNTGRPMTAVLLICFLAAFNRLLWRRRGIGYTFSASLIIALLPMIVSVNHSTASLTTRFQTMSVISQEPSFSGALCRLTENYLDYFTPRFLFISGDSNMRHNTGLGGELFWFLLPLIAAGLYCTIRFARRQPLYRVLLLALLTYPIAAALTLNRMHSTRSMNGVIPWLLLAAVGARWLWQQRRWGAKLLLPLAAIAVVEMSLYARDYFGPYSQRSRLWFQPGLSDALKFSFERLSSNETLYVSRSVGLPYGITPDAQFKPLLYIHFLFYGKIDPQVYQRNGFPPDRIVPYVMRISKPGLLLRCNAAIFNQDREGPVWASNPEPLPDGAIRLKVFPVTESLQLEVFKINAPPPPTE
jgi:4-amino-4-deoxy-L-arabinose transferase-like glycosyltransferase